MPRQIDVTPEIVCSQILEIGDNSLMPWTVEQKRAYNREYYQRNRKRLDARRNKRIQSDPELRQKNVERASRWNKTHVERRREIVKTYDSRLSEAAKQLNRERSKAWRLTHTGELSGKRIHRIRARDLRAKWAFWAGMCWMCGTPAQAWDHVKPLSKDGSFLLANLRPACRRCNSHKGAKWPWPLISYAQNEKAQERIQQGFKDRRVR